MSKEAYYFSHDANARQDEKILMLRAEHGWEGYGIFWLLIEMMFENKETALHHKKIKGIAVSYGIEIEKLESIVATCVEENLFESDGETFWSESLKRRKDKFLNLKARRAEAGKKGAAKRWNDGTGEAKEEQSDGKAIAKPKQSHSTAVAKDGKGKEKKLKEKEIKEERERHGDYVLLTPTQYNRLKERYGSGVVNRKIARMNAWISTKDVIPFKDFNQALHNWLKEDIPNAPEPTNIDKKKPKTEYEKQLNLKGVYENRLAKGYDYYEERNQLDVYERAQRDLAEVNEWLGKQEGRNNDEQLRSYQLTGTH